MNARFHRFATLVALGSVSAAAVAADVLEEVIVTAQKREQNLQDVPMSVSALSQDTIEHLGMQSFRDWSDYVAGIKMSYGLNSRRGGPIAVIRGVTNQVGGSVADVTANATTAYTIGEVPIFSVSPGLIDMNRIEVLKGPQGTLYGVAAMGGVVKYVPNYAETDKFSAKVGVGGGMIKSGGNTSDVSGMINVPLVEGVLAARFAGVYQYNGGFIDHIFPPLDQTDALVVDRPGYDPRVDVNDRGSDANGHYQRDANKTKTLGGRFGLTYTPNDKVTIRGFSMWQKGTVDDSWQIDANDRRDLVVSRYTLQPQSSEFNLTSLEASYDVGIGSLNYVGGYYENDLMETMDATKFIADQSIPLNGDPFPVAITFPFTTHTQQWTHELRLQGEDKSLGGISLFGSELKFDYVVGAFYQHEIRSGGINIAAPEWNANRGPNTAPIQTEGGLLSANWAFADYENKAAFVDLTLHVTDKLSIGAGVRRFDQVKVVDSKIYGVGAMRDGMFADDLSNPDFFPNGSSRGGRSQIANTGTTPKATVNYKINDDKMIYFSAANGQRIGANPPSQITPNIQPPECETLIRELGLYDDLTSGTKSDELWSYDLGLRSTWLDKRLLVNASVYNIDWTDLQQVVIVNSINRNCSQVIGANVGKANIKGFEFESVYSPIDSVKLNVTVAYADAGIVGDRPGVKDSTGQPLQDGDQIVGVPEWTGSLGAEYRFDVPPLPGMAENYLGYIRADWRYVGERINGFGDRESLEASIPFNVARSYHLTDVRIGAENQDWSIQLYVSNVFNKRAQYESLGNFFQPNIQDVAVAQPRTAGFSVSRKY